MMFVLSMTNKVINKTIKLLENPDRWNQDGDYQYGSYCIVTASFSAAITMRTNRNVDNGPALRLIEKIIKNRFDQHRAARSGQSEGTVIILTTIQKNPRRRK